MQGYDEAVRVLRDQAARRLAKLPEFHPLVTKPADGQVIAVDGSHAVLVDNGAVWVVAHRAAAISWPGPLLPVPAVITATTPDKAASLLGHPAAGADAFAAALRERAELAALGQAVATAPAGALVLADGALRGLPAEVQRDMDPVVRLARQRGVALVGVSKRSAIDEGGIPLVPALHEAGPAGVWAASVKERVFVARLHARAPCAFRVDADLVDEVARLVALSRDAAYVGYPYPLAKAHNHVACTGSVVAELKAGLERALRASGDEAAWRLAADFHAVLDRNVAG